jgi:hypothetical protein
MQRQQRDAFSTMGEWAKATATQEIYDLAN